MLQAQQPNVYLASAVPSSLAATDPRAQLIQNKVPAVKVAYANFITFQSKGGQSFRSIAKNKEWNKANDDDFYNDLVGPVLAESLEAATSGCCSVRKGHSSLRTLKQESESETCRSTRQFG